MFRFGFLFLPGFSCLFLCEGAVFPPSNRTNVTFIPESTEKMAWSLSDDIKSFSYRSWTFISSDGRPRVELARIIDDRDAEILTSSYKVAIEKPTTLVLKNVNLTYNGTYQFHLFPGGSSPEVVVYIAVKPNATACSSPVILNEGDNVSCVCQGQGGNPPADVTWYKDNRKIGETGKEEKTLTLTNVTNQKDHGSYKCLAQSHPNKIFQDEVIVKVIVYLKPNAMACSSTIIVNEGDNVSCACQGQGGNPPADVTWYKDNRKIGETGKEEKTLTLTNVTNEKHHGNYKCVAQSYPNKIFKDEVIVKVIVYSKPKKTKIEVPEEAYVGEKLVINCSSEGFPAPSFTITHNFISNIVSNNSRYIKDEVDYSDAGSYECIGKNVLGNDTDSDDLIVIEKRPSTKSTQSSPSKTTVRATDGIHVHVRGLSTGAIAGICVAVLLLLVIVIIVVYCCHKKKEKDGRNCGNQISGDHYELDNEEPVRGDNAYDTVAPVASGSQSNAPVKDNLPPVYTAVDTTNRHGNTLYASLDTDAMKPKRESKKEPERAPQTEYASIDFAKTGNTKKADPV